MEDDEETPEKYVITCDPSATSKVFFNTEAVKAWEARMNTYWAKQLTWPTKLPTNTSVQMTEPKEEIVPVLCNSAGCVFKTAKYYEQETKKAYCTECHAKMDTPTAMFMWGIKHPDKDASDRFELIKTKQERMDSYAEQSRKLRGYSYSIGAGVIAKSATQMAMEEEEKIRRKYFTDHIMSIPSESLFRATGTIKEKTVPDYKRTSFKSEPGVLPSDKKREELRKKRKKK